MLENLSLIVPFLVFLVALVGLIHKMVTTRRARKEKAEKESKEHLKSIQPKFGFGAGNKFNGNNWALNFVNKGQTAINVELDDPIGEMKPTTPIQREIKPNGAIYLKGGDPKSGITKNCDLPYYEATLRYQDKEGNEYSQKIIKKKGMSGFELIPPFE